METKVVPIEILLIEDNPGDAFLAQELFKECKITNNITIMDEGAMALQYLRKQGPYKDAITPHLILLDLNLPKVDGRKVLEELKKDPSLTVIPVVILTNSKTEEDIVRSYQMHANSYIRKPLELDAFISIVKSIEEYWLTIVELPGKKPT